MSPRELLLDFVVVVVIDGFCLDLFLNNKFQFDWVYLLIAICFVLIVCFFFRLRLLNAAKSAMIIFCFVV